MLRCIALQYGFKARGCCWPESFEKVIYRFFVPGLRVILCRWQEDAVISSGKCELWLRIEAVV
ncbi:hypothetical protein [Anaplasma phagocytophilum]|uniref:hypothetical protein n=1 Tax=Anaplasma phagocytophilum TaxID=948 RepID=UPI000B1421AD|nr:hypothetical protein [Anaplasma phagocytophilum]